MPEKVTILSSIQQLEIEVLIAVASQQNKVKFMSEILIAFSDVQKGEKIIDLGILSTILERLESKRHITSQIVIVATESGKLVERKQFSITSCGRVAIVEREEQANQNVTDSEFQPT